MQFSLLFVTMILLNMFSYITIRLRPKLYDVDLFKPMLWNFKLSLAPLFVLLLSIVSSLVLIIISNYSEITFLRYCAALVFFIGLVIWFLLLPNSGYLITELNLTHRNMDKKTVPIWYDIISVLSFALSGIINTMFNIVLIIICILVYFDPDHVSSKNNMLLFLLALTIIIFVSIGIYLGRSIRFNTWDILHPTTFFKKLLSHFKTPGVIQDAFLFILFHTLFFLIFYYMLGIPYYFVAS